MQPGGRPAWQAAAGAAAARRALKLVPLAGWQSPPERTLAVSRRVTVRRENGWAD